LNKGVFAKQKTPANNLSFGDHICKEEGKIDNKKQQHECLFLKEFFLFVAKLAIIHTKMSKKKVTIAKSKSGYKSYLK
jgi:hypothetical protein